MGSTAVQKIAKVLNVLVLITFICNLTALFLVPGLVFASQQARAHLLFHVAPRYFLLAWTGVWCNAYLAVLTLFLLFSGGSTAVILWQARRVLKTILQGEPFSMENAVSLKRAAACAFFIAATALARVVFSVCFYRSAAPLATYNALFVPLFTMFGLLCLVMSALFRQAAKLKAENDLTI